MERRRTFKYTTRSIAEAAGLSVWTVRRDIRNGVFDIADLKSVSLYIAWRAK